MSKLINSVYIILALAGITGAALSYAEPESKEILRRADSARGSMSGVTWKVTVESSENGRTNSLLFSVQARGHDVLAQTMEPPNHKGDKLLVLKNNMWFHKKDLSKPVPVSQRQKLLGNASYGDIATTSYADDYDATSILTDTINGEECSLMDLSAKTKKATYDRIKYWISKSRTVGLKADYYTVSGKLFKSASMEYEHRIQMPGNQDQLFISRMIIRDEMMSSNVTTMTFSPPALKEIPDHVFDLNLLKK